MADATVTLGLNASEFKSGLSKAQNDVSVFTQNSQKSFARLGAAVAKTNGGGAKFQLGNMGAQLQDVAVQAQMGTNALTIFAQQGSQVAGAFGPMGMVVGAGVAVFGALALAVFKNREAFDKAVAGADAFVNAINNLDPTATVDQIASALSKGTEQMAELRKEAEKLESVMGYITANAGGIFSGRGASTRTLESDFAQGDAMMARVNAGKQAVAIGERETKIAELLAAGKKEQADEAQRLLDLEREIAAIRAKGFTKNSEDKLIEQATRRSEVSGGQDEAAKRKEESQRRVSGQRGLAEARRAVEQFGESDTDKLKRLEQERAKLAHEVAAAKGDEFKQMQLAADLAKKDLDILQTKKSIEENIARSKREQADEAERAFDKEAAPQEKAKDRAKSAAKEAKSQSVAKADLMTQMRILAAKASGQNDLADELEKEAEIRKRAKDIADQTGVSVAKAMAISRQFQSLQDAADKTKDRPEGRIQGYSSERQGGRDEAHGRAAQRAADSAAKRAGAYSRGFGGLSEFYGNQTDSNFARPITPSLDAMKANPAGSTSPVVSSIQQLEQTIKAILSVD